MDFLFIPFLGQALWLWLMVLGIVGAVLALDLGVFNKKDHVIGVAESLKMSLVYIVLGLIFGLCFTSLHRGLSFCIWMGLLWGAPALADSKLAKGTDRPA